MQIRAVSADDHAAWLPLWQGYQRFYATEIPEATSRPVSYTHLRAHET